MIFLHPNVLWSLPGVLIAGVALYFWSRRVRRRRLSLFTTFHETGEILRSRRETARIAGHGLLTLGLVFLLVALARPLTGPRPGTAKSQGIDLLLAIDVSKSMLTPDVKTSRLESVRAALRAWLPGRAGDRAGIILSAGDAFLQIPLTGDLGAVDTLIAAARPTGRGGSNLEAAIQSAIDVYDRQPGPSRTLLLFSDGESTEGDPVAKAAEAFQSHGIRVFTIGVGTPEGGQVPNIIQNGIVGGQVRNAYGVGVHSRLDATSLRAIAAAGGGAYVSLTGDASALDDLQGRQLSRLRRETREIQAADYDEWFQLPLLLALLCLVGERFTHRLSAARLLLAKAGRKLPGAACFLCLLLTFAQGEETGPGTAACQQLIAKGQAGAAVALLRAEATRRPDDAFTLYNLGVAGYAAGDFQEAVHAFERVLNLPDDRLRAKALLQLGNAHVRLGETLLARGDTGAAAAEFERALDNYGNPGVASRGLRHNGEAAERLYLDTLEQVAAGQLQLAMRTTDNWTQRRILQKSLGALTRILDRKPDLALAMRQDREVRALLVANLVADGRKKQAEAKATLARGNFKAAYVPMRTAFELASHAVEISPQDPGAQAFLAETRRDFSTMLTTRGEEEFSQAMKTEKLSTRLGLLASAAGRANEALALDPANDAARALDAKTRAETEKAAVADGDRLASAAEAARTAAGIAVNLTQAINRYRQALEANPANTRAQEQLARLQPRLADALLAMGASELAAARTALGTQADPSAGTLQKALGHLGKADEALAQAATLNAGGEKLKPLAAEVAALTAKLQTRLDQLAGSGRAPGKDAAKAGAKDGKAKSSAGHGEGAQPAKSKSFADIRKVSSGARQPPPAKDW